jgi:subtilisin family serine protease
VASIVAGAGEKQRGVARDAKIALGKVGDRVMFESHILAGMEWAAVEVKAKVVNMSLGGPDTPDADPLEQAVDTLSARTGALFVISAGNDGLAGTVGSPGSADAALTVGAVDRDDMKASFSSAGPRKGDHAIKPDVTAPGVEIMAAAPAGTADGPYVAHSGTSMAAPHVAGAAAILAQRHPDWNGARLKAALIGSAAPNGSATPYQEGAGRVDLVRALAQPVVETTGNVWAACHGRRVRGQPRAPANPRRHGLAKWVLSRRVAGENLAEVWPSAGSRPRPRGRGTATARGVRARAAPSDTQRKAALPWSAGKVGRG